MEKLKTVKEADKRGAAIEGSPVQEVKKDATPMVTKVETPREKAAEKAAKNAPKRKAPKAPAVEVIKFNFVAPAAVKAVKMSEADAVNLDRTAAVYASPVLKAEHLTLMTSDGLAAICAGVLSTFRDAFRILEKRLGKDKATELILTKCAEADRKRVQGAIRQLVFQEKKKAAKKAAKKGEGEGTEGEGTKGEGTKGEGEGTKGKGPDATAAPRSLKGQAEVVLANEALIKEIFKLAAKDEDLLNLMSDAADEAGLKLSFKK